MTLSPDDDVTIVEIGVIVIGLVITWAVYRRARRASREAAAGAEQVSEVSEQGPPTDAMDLEP